MTEDTLVHRPGSMAAPGWGAFFTPGACMTLLAGWRLADQVMADKYTPEEAQVSLDLAAALETGAGA